MQYSGIRGLYGGQGATPGELATQPKRPDLLDEEDAELRRRGRFDTKRCAQRARLLKEGSERDAYKRGGSCTVAKVPRQRAGP